MRTSLNKRGILQYDIATVTRVTGLPEMVVLYRTQGHWVAVCRGLAACIAIARVLGPGSEAVRQGPSGGQPCVHGMESSSNASRCRATRFSRRNAEARTLIRQEI